MILLGKLALPEGGGERGETGRRLGSVINRINREGRSQAAPFRVTEPGEEFVAAYRDARYLFDHIWLILYELYPARVRFSIGLGSRTADKKGEMLDSRALRSAIEGIDELEKGEHLFRITGYPGKEGELINCALSLVSERMVKWNKKRFAVLYALSRNREISEVARLLEISERSVYKNINAGSLETILHTAKQISGFLDG